MTTLKNIRTIKDYPKPGVDFYDITPLLQNPKAFTEVIKQMAENAAQYEFDKIVGIEARGFIFAAALAAVMKKGLVLVRKKGKLPYETLSESYQLEYGSDTVEMHIDSITEGEKVLIVDDVIATGGTMEATIKLINKSKGQISGALCLILLQALHSKQKLEQHGINLCSLYSV